MALMNEKPYNMSFVSANKHMIIACTYKYYPDFVTKNGIFTPDFVTILSQITPKFVTKTGGLCPLL